ncbi:MAG: LamG-like jellyroll fold domain-containing protein [Terrimicrobiaceae bacterium]
MTKFLRYLFSIALCLHGIGSPARAGSFDPAQFGDLALWFDAGNGPVLEGNKISAWRSRVGELQLTQEEKAWFPTLIEKGPGGQPTAEFDYCASLTGRCKNPVKGEKVLVAVIQIPDKGQSGQARIFGLREDEGIEAVMPDELYLRFFFPPFEKKYGRDRFVGPLHGARAAFAKAPLRELSVVTAVYGSEKTQLFVNGENKATTEMGLGSEGGEASMGANKKGGSYFTGLISEILVFQGTMTDEQRAALEKTLAQKYNISLK